MDAEDSVSIAVEDEDILSPELRELLAQSSGGAEILQSNKKKKKQQQVESVPLEPVVISKSMQRKLDALKKRKENEAKRAQCLEEINKHKLSEEHQQLMVSARDQGQKKTSKWRLKMIIKRHRAGLALNDQERELLLPYLDSQIALSSDDEAGDNSSNPAKKWKPSESVVPTVTHSAIPSDVVTADARDYGATIAATDGSAPLAAAPKAELSQLSRLIAPEEEPDDGLTMAERLMAQFRQLQNKVAEDNAARVEPAGRTVDYDYTAEFAAKRDPHVISDGISAMDRLIELHRDGVVASETPGIAPRKRFFVNREDSIQLGRLQLPVCAMEQEIVEAINAHDAVILCGETGSGKSTQVPQFLYEAGYCAEEGVKIGITQPRRVAASSTAIRVAVEMNCPIGGNGYLTADEEEQRNEKKLKKRKRKIVSLGPVKQLVGYQVRHDSSTMTKDTCIKYMTDGILLREITSDLLLRQYSVIILDEAHERNINTDVLLGLLSRALILRRAQAQQESAVYNAMPEDAREGYVRPIRPLKLVIMSATLRINDFLNTRLFPPPTPFPPVIKVEARQYPVVPHFAKKTELHNYTKMAYKKVIQIHRKLPDGGILVFLTGKREIMQMTNKLRRYFNRRSIGVSVAEDDAKADIVIDTGGLLGVWAQGDEAENADEDAAGAATRYRSHSGRHSRGQTRQGSDSEGSYDSGSSAGDSDDFTSDDEKSGNERELNTSRTSVLPSTTVQPAPTTPVISSERNTLLQQLLMGGGIHDISEQTVNVPHSSAPLQVDQSPEEEEDKQKNALVLPLFAMLSAEQQARVFQQPPSGTRLIVIATNVAETSITIPGVRYVIDCGRYKEKVVRSASGISKYEVQWISKASADQRMGRAGRTGPGHCYRLFSSAFYDQHMKEFQPPEILKTPLEDLLLQMRSLGIGDVERFPFPTPPTPGAISTALNTLGYLAAVSDVQPAATSSTLAPRPINRITTLGRLLAQFPVGARYAKMLVVAQRSMGLSPSLACALVSVLTERPPFISRRNKFSLVGEKRKASDDSDSSDSDGDKKEEDEKSAAGLAFHPTSDALARLRALGAFIHARMHAGAAPGGNKQGAGGDKVAKEVAQFCAKHFLHQPSLERALELARQLCGLYRDILGGIGDEAEGDPMDVLRPPSADEELALRQVLVTGLPDCIARRAKMGAVATGSRKQRLTAYFSCNPSVTKPLYLHPESCLYRKDPAAALPEYVVYGQLVENEMGTFTYMTSVTAVEEAWIPDLTKDCPLLKFSEPLQSPQPSYDAETDEVRCYVVPTYGIHNWELAPMRTSLAEACAGGKRNNSNVNPGLEAELGTLPGYRKTDEAVRWFARLLLEGAVLDDPLLRGVFVKKNIKLALSTLTSLKVTKSGSQLLLKLAKEAVCTVARLKEVLKEMPLFLYEELQACLHMEARKHFRLQWTRFVQNL